MAGKRHALAGVAAAAIAACTLVAGCGGGGDEDTSTAASVPTVPQVTSPAPAKPDREPTTTRTSPGAEPAAPGPGQLPQGVRGFQEALGPFRECLDRKGVTLPFVRGSGAGPPDLNSAQYREQVEKAFTCIPELPPRFRERAELLKRRFEQRFGEG